MFQLGDAFRLIGPVVKRNKSDVKSHILIVHAAASCLSLLLQDWKRHKIKQVSFWTCETSLVTLSVSLGCCVVHLLLIVVLRGVDLLVVAKVLLVELLVHLLLELLLERLMILKGVVLEHLGISKRWLLAVKYLLLLLDHEWIL